jgi:isopenicillin N synthase-like dioxygenase
VTVARVPVIDLGGLTRDASPAVLERVGAEIDRAAREVGFFAVVNHGVESGLSERLFRTAHEFFAAPEPTKESVAMQRGGTAWRGWFPLHGELTSGVPDHKEGYYFGRELPPDDPRVEAGLPLHGPNLFPARPPTVRPVVLEYLDRLEDLGQRVTRAISVALGLGPDGLTRRWFQDPVILLRWFRYPPARATDPPVGVGEHTDYGFLTLLARDPGPDDVDGLEVRVDDTWIEVPPIPDAFVCNVGDMLERATRGRYRSTPHRVRPPATGDRLSVPFFFDPDWDAPMGPLVASETDPGDDADRRWDGTSVHQFDGSYGEYLVGKVAKVFPALRDAVL